MSDLNRRRRLIRATLALLLLLVVTVPGLAFAMTDAKVTIDQKTGGVPTRFTFAATTDEAANVTEIDFLFPEGFDTEETEVDVTLLEGLTRIPTDYTFEVDAATNAVKVFFDPPIDPQSNIFMQIRNIRTPIAGGTYELPVEYVVVEDVGAGAEQRLTQPDLTFKYETPSRDEIISRWLDGQSWVEAWNGVKFLNLFLKPQQIVRAVPLLFEGWLLSLALVLTAFPISIVGGLGTAFMKMSKLPPLRWLASAYINIIRGTPLFLQIFVVFIGLRTSGVRLPDFISAVIVLAFNSSAYLAEIFRAGIQSISKGQFEAASSLGMTYRQAMQYVIIPQTVRRVLPTMTSEFILLFKDTALFAAMGIFELMLRSQNFVARSGNLSAYVVAAGYYLIITIPLINLVSRLEARLAQSEYGVDAGSGKKHGRRRRGELLSAPAAATVDPYRAGAKASIGEGPQVDYDNAPAKHESR